MVAIVLLYCQREAEVVQFGSSILNLACQVFKGVNAVAFQKSDLLARLSHKTQDAIFLLVCADQQFLEHLDLFLRALQGLGPFHVRRNSR